MSAGSHDLARCEVRTKGAGLRVARGPRSTAALSREDLVRYADERWQDVRAVLRRGNLYQGILEEPVRLLSRDLHYWLPLDGSPELAAVFMGDFFALSLADRVRVAKRLAEKLGRGFEEVLGQRAEAGFFPVYVRDVIVVRGTVDVPVRGGAR